MILVLLLTYIAVGIVVSAAFALSIYATDAGAPPTYGQVIATCLLWPLILFVLVFTHAERVFNTTLWGSKKEKQDD